MAKKADAKKSAPKKVATAAPRKRTSANKTSKTGADNEADEFDGTTTTSGEQAPDQEQLQQETDEANKTAIDLGQKNAAKKENKQVPFDPRTTSGNPL